MEDLGVFKTTKIDEALGNEPKSVGYKLVQTCQCRSFILGFSEVPKVFRVP